MGVGVWQVVLVLVIVLIFFGAGRLPSVMGDLGKGIRNFRSSMRTDGEAVPPADAEEAGSRKALPDRTKDEAANR